MAKGPLDVRLYRSSVKGRRPQPADMAYGDVAINYNHEDPALIIKGDNNALIEFKPGSGVTVSATAPASAKDGDLWWDTTSARLFLRYTSGTPAVTTWVDASPAAVPPTLANALTYKGTIDPTAAGSAPASPKVGDTYVVSKAGTAAAGWAGLASSSVSLHELLVWDGTEWDGAGTAASARTAWQGVIDPTVAKTAGYTAAAGDLIKLSKVGTVHADWSGVSASANVGDVYLFDGAAWRDVTAGGWARTGTTLTPAVSGDQVDPACLPAATTAARGVVQLADAAAVTAGTAGRVVDAAQLKSAQVWSRSGTTLSPATSGDLVTEAALPSASESAKGAIELATTAETAAGTDNMRAVTPLKLSGVVSRSATAPVAPVRGQLWVDTTSDPPVVRIWDDTPAPGLWKAASGGIASGAVAPASPARGDAWVDTSGSGDPALKIWDGSKWSPVSMSLWSRTGTTLSPATNGDLIAPAALPVASATTLGAIKIGSNLTIDADGVLKANLSSALVFRGAKDPTAAAPATPATGDVYVMSKAGTVDASWTGIAGASVAIHDLTIWDGTEWDLMGPAIATTVHTVTATAPLNVTGTATVALSVDDATATSKGVVQLADAAAVTAGTAGRVVDAAQLKAAVAAEDLWDRTGTEISPKTAGDSVFTSGDVKVGGTTAAPAAKVAANGDITGQAINVTGDTHATHSTVRDLKGATTTRYGFNLGNDAGQQRGTLDLMSAVAAVANLTAISVRKGGETKFRIGVDGTTQWGTGPDTGLVSTARAAVDPNTGNATFLGVLKVGNTGYFAEESASSPPRLILGVDPLLTPSVARNLEFWLNTNGAKATNKATLTSTGDFLLGGTLPASPAVKLEAAGSIALAGANATHQISIGKTGIDTLKAGVDSSGSFISCSGALSFKPRQVAAGAALLHLYRGAAEVLQINSANDLLLGGTLPASPNITLSAAGKISIGRQFIFLVNKTNVGTTRKTAIETVSTDGGTNTPTAFLNTRYGAGKWVLLAAFNTAGDAISATTNCSAGSTFVVCITDAATNFNA